MTASEKVKKIQAPTPFFLEKSGIPLTVNVLNSVAAKVIKPRTSPIFVPPSIKSFAERMVFLLFQERKINTPI